jgi:hypothetical protein
MPDSLKKQVRIVAFKDGDGWAAHCVEYDIAAAGKDLPTVQRNMQAVLHAECLYTEKKYGEAMRNIPPAPDYIAALYEEAEAALDSELNFRIAA